MWLLLWLLRGRQWTFGALFDGEDRGPSTSKFQFCVWTVVVLYAYVGLSAARWFRGQAGFLGEIPPNLLIAMGLSAGTALGAKAITSYKFRSGREVKRHAPAAPLAEAAPSANGLPVWATWSRTTRGRRACPRRSSWPGRWWPCGTYLLLIWTQIGEVLATLTPGTDCAVVAPPRSAPERPAGHRRRDHGADGPRPGRVPRREAGPGRPAAARHSPSGRAAIRAPVPRASTSAGGDRWSSAA